MTFSTFAPESAAVITGGAAGIGLAAAKRFAGRGLRICIADFDEQRLAAAAEAIALVSANGAADVLAVRRMSAASRIWNGCVDRSTSVSAARTS
jgi:NADP-dependent 3-hydroxy acid dehydrogenase YdfG